MSNNNNNNNNPQEQSLTRLEYLQRVPPFVVFGGVNDTRSFRNDARSSCGSTVVTFEAVPAVVVPWPDFVAQVHAFPVDNLDHRLPLPAFFPASTIAGYEAAAAQHCFAVNFCHRLLHPEFGVQLGVQPSNDDVPADLLLTKHYSLIIEMKRPSGHWAHAADLAAAYRGDRSALVVDAVHQLYGYMSTGMHRYGVLSTYNMTWFFRRSTNDSSILEISPAILMQRQVPSVSQCLWYLLNRPDHLVPEFPATSAAVQPITDSSEDEHGSGLGSGSGSDDTFIPSSDLSSPRESSHRTRTKRNFEEQPEEERCPWKPLMGCIVLCPPSDASSSHVTVAKELEFRSCEYGGTPGTLVTCRGRDPSPLADMVENIQQVPAALVGSSVPRLLAYGTLDGKPAAILERAQPITSAMLARMTTSQKVAVLEALRHMFRSGWVPCRSLSLEQLCLTQHDCSSAQQKEERASSVVLDTQKDARILPLNGISHCSQKSVKLRIAEEVRNLLYPVQPLESAAELGSGNAVESTTMEAEMELEEKQSLCVEDEKQT